MGPTLYSLNTADMPVEKNIVISTYADDTAILVSNQNADAAANPTEAHLHKVFDWSKKRKLEINSEISKSSEVKYLSLHFDRKLIWKTHIDQKCKQIRLNSTDLKWLINTKWRLDHMLLLYEVVILPISTYEIPLWGKAITSSIFKILRTHNKVLWLITGAPRHFNNTLLHNELRLNPIKKVIESYIQTIEQIETKRPSKRSSKSTRNK